MRITGLLLLLVLWASPAQAAGTYYVSGNDVWEVCKEREQKITGARLACIGIVSAFADTMKASNKACLPDGTNVLQVRAVFTAYLEELPEVRTYPAILLAHLALSEVWPCPAEGQ